MDEVGKNIGSKIKSIKYTSASEIIKRYSAKHVAVTGGASGIGKAMVERSANEGATVYILDVNNEAATTVVNDIVE